MLLESFLICPVCAADVYIVAAMVDEHLLYQGKCTNCDVVAQESSNYQRALDFWNAWHAPADPPSAPEAEPEGEPEGELEVEPEAEPEAEPEGELEVEPEAEPEAEPEGELEVEPEVEPEAEPEVEPEAEPEPEGTKPEAPA